MSLLLFLAAASVQAAPAPAPSASVEAGAEPKTERVCKKVMTPDSRVAKKICARVKVKEPVAQPTEATTEQPVEG